MKTLKILLGISFILSSTLAFSQDRIQLMNAKSIDAKVLEVSGDHIVYKKFEKQSGGSKKINKGRVFMVAYENGKEEIIYKQDTTDEQSLHPDDMQMFISGKRDARIYFKAPGNFYGGIVAGALGGFVVPPIYSPVVPALFATVSEMHAPCLSKQQLSYCFDLCNENYVSGYMKQAGNKKVNNALLGGLIGIVGSLAVVTLTGVSLTPMIVEALDK